MLIASYEQWREQKRKALEEENPAVSCEECNGFGYTHSICECCGSELEEGCELCEGSGEVYYLDSTKPRPGNDLVGRTIYFQEVIADLKRWSAYTGQDFLAITGGFVNDFRKQPR